MTGDSIRTPGGLRLTEARVGDLLSLGAAASFALYGIVNKLKPALSAWDSATGALGYWYRDVS